MLNNTFTTYVGKNKKIMPVISSALVLLVTPLLVNAADTLEKQRTNVNEKAITDGSEDDSSPFSYQIYEGVSAELSGYVMLDYDAFQNTFLEKTGGESDEFSDNAEFRRARLSLKIKAFDTVTAKLQLAAEDSELSIKDAYLQWKLNWHGSDLFTITAGKQKEPFGFEKLLSSRKSLLGERSMNSEAFSPGRSIGVMLSGEFLNKDAITWQLGYFSPESSEQTAVTGRLTYAPINKKNSTLHFGAAFSEREYQGEEYRINERLEVHGADSLIEGKKLDADNVSLAGAELLWRYHGFTALAEWQQSDVITTSNDSYQYSGGNIQMSYLLFGAKRKYKKGMLSDGDFENQWELTSRYSVLNLEQEAENAKTISLGVNYYLNKNTKVMANVIHGEYEVDDETLSGNALALRLQYQF